MIDFGDSGLRTIQGWLDGLAGRREAIADTIANIDTPGYQRRTVDFETELRRSIGTNRGPMSTTQPGHISQVRGVRGGLGLDGVSELVSSRRDGNSVQIDQEMILLAETQMRYQAASAALNRKFALIREALRSF